MAADAYYNFLHDALDRVEQLSTVEEFYHRFEAIRNLVASSRPWLPEAYFTDRFIYGLRNNIQPHVIRFIPITVLDAFYLANIYEYSLSQSCEYGDVMDFNTFMVDPMPIDEDEGFGTFVHNELDCIQQHSNVSEFHLQFELVRSLLSSIRPWLPESYFTDRFIYGLHEDIQAYVIRFHPITVVDAFHLACLYEYSVSQQLYDYKDVVEVKNFEVAPSLSNEGIQAVFVTDSSDALSVNQDESHILEKLPGAAVTSFLPVRQLEEVPKLMGNFDVNILDETGLNCSVAIKDNICEGTSNLNNVNSNHQGGIDTGKQSMVDDHIKDIDPSVSASDFEKLLNTNFEFHPAFRISLREGVRFEVRIVTIQYEEVKYILYVLKESLDPNAVGIISLLAVAENFQQVTEASLEYVLLCATSSPAKEGSHMALYIWYFDPVLLMLHKIKVACIFSSVWWHLTLSPVQVLTEKNVVVLNFLYLLRGPDLHLSQWQFNSVWPYFDRYQGNDKVVVENKQEKLARVTLTRIFHYISVQHQVCDSVVGLDWDQVDHLTRPAVAPFQCISTCRQTVSDAAAAPFYSVYSCASTLWLIAGTIQCLQWSYCSDLLSAIDAYNRGIHPEVLQFTSFWFITRVPIIDDAHTPVVSFSNDSCSTYRGSTWRSQEDYIYGHKHVTLCVQVRLALSSCSTEQLAVFVFVCFDPGILCSAFSANADDEQVSWSVIYGAHFRVFLLVLLRSHSTCLFLLDTKLLRSYCLGSNLPSHAALWIFDPGIESSAFDRFKVSTISWVLIQVSRESQVVTTTSSTVFYYGSEVYTNCHFNIFPVLMEQIQDDGSVIKEYTGGPSTITNHLYQVYDGKTLPLSKSVNLAASAHLVVVQIVGRYKGTSSLCSDGVLVSTMTVKEFLFVISMAEYIQSPYKIAGAVMCKYSLFYGDIKGIYLKALVVESGLTTREFYNESVICDVTVCYLLYRVAAHSIIIEGYSQFQEFKVMSFVVMATCVNSGGVKGIFRLVNKVLVYTDIEGEDLYFTWTSAQYCTRLVSIEFALGIVSKFSRGCWFGVNLEVQNLSTLHKYIALQGYLVFSEIHATHVSGVLAVGVREYAVHKLRFVDSVISLLQYGTSSFLRHINRVSLLVGQSHRCLRVSASQGTWSLAEFSCYAHTVDNTDWVCNLDYTTPAAKSQRHASCFGSMDFSSGYVVLVTSIIGVVFTVTDLISEGAKFRMHTHKFSCGKTVYDPGGQSVDLFKQLGIATEAFILPLKETGTVELWAAKKVTSIEVGMGGTKLRFPYSYLGMCSEVNKSNQWLLGLSGIGCVSHSVLFSGHKSLLNSLWLQVAFCHSMAWDSYTMSIHIEWAVEHLLKFLWRIAWINFRIHDILESPL